MINKLLICGIVLLSLALLMMERQETDHEQFNQKNTERTNNESESIQVVKTTANRITLSSEKKTPEQFLLGPGESEAEKNAPVQPGPGESEAEKNAPVQPGPGESEAEKNAPVRPGPGESEPEKNAPIQPGPGESEAEKNAPIQPGPGESEEEKNAPIHPGPGEGL